MATSETEQKARQIWMGVLAKAAPDHLNELAESAGNWPSFSWLRPPESGGVMVRGRMGGTGAAFNVGEMTVTRCALRLDDGTVGYGYVQGRNKRHAEQAAVVDAMMQTKRADQVRADILDPLQAKAEHTRRSRAERAAATKVEFFTMVRGED